MRSERRDRTAHGRHSQADCGRRQRRRRGCRRRNRRGKTRDGVERRHVQVAGPLQVSLDRLRHGHLAEARRRATNRAQRAPQACARVLTLDVVAGAACFIDHAMQVLAQAHYFHAEPLRRRRGWVGRLAHDVRTGIVEEVVGDGLDAIRARLVGRNGIQRRQKGAVLRRLGVHRPAGGDRCGDGAQQIRGRTQDDHVVRGQLGFAQFERAHGRFRRLRGFGECRDLAHSGHATQRTHPLQRGGRRIPIAGPGGQQFKATGEMGCLGAEVRRGGRRCGRCGACRRRSDILRQLTDALHGQLIFVRGPRAGRADEDLQVVDGGSERALERGIEREGASLEGPPQCLDGGRELHEHADLGHLGAAPQGACRALEGVGLQGGGSRAQQNPVELLDVLAGFQREEVEVGCAWRGHRQWKVF